jgi:hypothetical protein
MASADGILRVNAKNQGRGQSYLRSLVAQQDALLQPYLATVSTYYERALVFIAGEFSHAVTKKPFMHADSNLGKRSRFPPGAAGEVPVEATKDEILAATSALEASPQGHMFARVDLLHDGKSHLVLEVELIEPALYFYAQPFAAQALAQVVVSCGQSA